MVVKQPERLRGFEGNNILFHCRLVEDRNSSVLALKLLITQLFVGQLLVKCITRVCARDMFYFTTDLRQ